MPRWRNISIVVSLLYLN